MYKITKNNNKTENVLYVLLLFFSSYSIEAGITETIQTAPEEPDTVKVRNSTHSDIKTHNLSPYLNVKCFFSII